MSKIKVDKRVVLTALSAIFGAGGFIIDILAHKDDTEEIAQRAAEIIEEKNKSADEHIEIGEI